MFPVDQVPHDHPLVTSGLPNTAPSFCGGISTSLKWFWWDFVTLSANQFLSVAGRQEIDMPGVNAFYAYSYPNSWSANTGREVSNTINMFFLLDESPAFFHFYILDKAWDGSGGNYRMTLSGMPPTFGVARHPMGTGMAGPGGTHASNPIDFHDRYTTATAPHYPGAVPYTPPEPGTLPIMLRDDPWNSYEYDESTGRYNFHWYWLECCTDGMVLGPMPNAAEAPIGFNVTYEGNCSNMVGLEQGTRISMWNLLGPPYRPGGCDGAQFRPALPTIRAANWIHYDVPMHQTCDATSGIQLSALPCETSCAAYTDCGACSSQLDCGWDPVAKQCQASCLPSTSGAALTVYGQCCSVCSSITDPFSCMCEEGCGWAPLDNRTASGPLGFCLSGTADYPCNQTTTIVQWESKGCPKDCGPSPPPAPFTSLPPPPPPMCCAADGARSQCYRAAYNEKSSLASSGLMEEYGMLPATRYPWGSGQPVPAFDMWSTTPSVPTQPVYGATAFFAYGNPDEYSSNTGYETENCMVTFLVQGDDCKTYLLVLVDKPGDGTGGFLQLSLTTTGVDSSTFGVLGTNSYGTGGPTGAPIAFLNDPQTRYDTYDSYHSGVVDFEWDGCCNDGMVIGPLPYEKDWSVHMHVITKETRGLDCFKIGTYDAERNDLGFVSANIRKATTKWGGLRYDSMECTAWCQRYSSCESCFRDEQCMFSAEHGGCIAADAYIYDFGCSRPAAPMTTKLMKRGAEAYEREAGLDGFDSQIVIRYSLPEGLDMTCPCSYRYRICTTIYTEAMEPVLTPECVSPRVDYQYTFVDFNGGGENGATYFAYSYLCVEQGTLGRDDCSPVTIDQFTLDNSPPPPSPPPP